MAASATHKFQAPKGTRDFYPEDMAVRRHLEAVWQRVSINHGFDEIDGPTFEHLDLYTVKSGAEIVSELFSFRRAGGDRDYALRPEFTPTLARMYASAARALPKPTRWFCIPSHFRAERPQRGRLREFFQWNVDVLGDETTRADAEVIAVTIGVFKALGLTPELVRIRISHRVAIQRVLVEFGLPEHHLAKAFTLIDATDKLPGDEFKTRALALGLPSSQWDEFDAYLRDMRPARAAEPDVLNLTELGPLHHELGKRGLLEWCDYKPSLARGLNYYTGTVFEAQAANERAVAGGGRYDKLIEMFGGPPTPAVGCAMGDVVLRLLLEDSGKLDSPKAYMPRPDAFLINLQEDDPVILDEITAELRDAGLHVRHSSRTTRNLGKLLGDANKVRARRAVILGGELAQGRVTVKDLETGDQREVPRSELLAALQTG